MNPHTSTNVTQPIEQSPWPRRLAVATAVATLPLLLVGGMVTTLEVGMAVPDWPTTFEHNMFTYPLSEMLKDTGVFWEHSHRLLGSLVGLLILATTIATWWKEPRTWLRVLATVALLCVIGQGIIGGYRVLETNRSLAFLHGSLAQAVFVLLACLALCFTPEWKSAGVRACKTARMLRPLTLGTTLLVYAQSVVGAWLRHGHQHLALALHIVLATLAAATIVTLAGRMKLAVQHGEAGGHDRSALRRWRVRLLVCLWTQFTLGILAALWIFALAGPNAAVTVGEQIFATAHVAVGALLLFACAASTLWTWRLVSSSAACTTTDALRPEGAR